MTACFRNFLRSALLGMALIAVAGSVTAQTNVSGTITTRTWTKANSPYRVTGTITVPAANVLTIEPGVDVLFDSHVQFVIQGRLQALGTSTDSIRFTVLPEGACVS